MRRFFFVAFISSPFSRLYTFQFKIFFGKEKHNIFFLQSITNTKEVSNKRKKRERERNEIEFIRSSHTWRSKELWRKWTKNCSMIAILHTRWLFFPFAFIVLSLALARVRCLIFVCRIFFFALLSHVNCLFIALRYSSVTKRKYFCSTKSLIYTNQCIHTELEHEQLFSQNKR